MGVSIDQMSKARRSKAGRTLFYSRHLRRAQDLRYQVTELVINLELSWPIE
jgi:hypothetical protein